MLHLLSNRVRDCVCVKDTNLHTFYSNLYSNIYKIHIYNTSKYKVRVKSLNFKKSNCMLFLFCPFTKFQLRHQLQKAFWYLKFGGKTKHFPDTVQQTQTVFLCWWSKGFPIFFWPLSLRRMVSLTEFFRCEVVGRLAGWALRLKPFRLCFFTRGPELDSSNVLLKFAGGVLSTSWAFIWPGVDSFKFFWSMMVFVELVGTRPTDRLLFKESCILRVRAFVQFSSSGSGSFEGMTAAWTFPRAISVGTSK